MVVLFITTARAYKNLGLHRSELCKAYLKPNAYFKIRSKYTALRLYKSSCFQAKTSHGYIQKLET
jgi:hypothetical protein